MAAVAPGRAGRRISDPEIGVALRVGHGMPPLHPSADARQDRSRGPSAGPCPRQARQRRPSSHEASRCWREQAIDLGSGAQPASGPPRSRRAGEGVTSVPIQAALSFTGNRASAAAAQPRPPQREVRPAARHRAAIRRSRHRAPVLLAGSRWWPASAQARATAADGGRDPARPPRGLADGWWPWSS
jgi:hypothetical protein